MRFSYLRLLKMKTGRYYRVFLVKFDNHRSKDKREISLSWQIVEGKLGQAQPRQVEQQEQELQIR